MLTCGIIRAVRPLALYSRRSLKQFCKLSLSLVPIWTNPDRQLVSLWHLLLWEHRNPNPAVCAAGCSILPSHTQVISISSPHSTTHSNAFCLASWLFFSFPDTLYDCFNLEWMRVCAFVYSYTSGTLVFVYISVLYSILCSLHFWPRCTNAWFEFYSHCVNHLQLCFFPSSFYFLLNKCRCRTRFILFIFFLHHDGNLCSCWQTSVKHPHRQESRTRASFAILLVLTFRNVRMPVEVCGVWDFYFFGLSLQVCWTEMCRAHGPPGAY